jgi:hypothetical protein
MDLSCSGDYNNFEDMEFGEATAETAITVPVLNTEFNEGKWLYSGDVLFVGTGASEFYIDSLSQNSAMAGDNIKISQISGYPILFTILFLITLSSSNQIKTFFFIKKYFLSFI